MRAFLSRSTFIVATAALSMGLPALNGVTAADRSSSLIPQDQSSRTSDCELSARTSVNHGDEKAPQRSSSQVAIDLITHNWIQINRLPAEVWPFIVNSNAWTKLHLQHRGGPKELVGELFCVVDPREPDIVLAFAETVEMTVQRRRILKLSEKVGSLNGYVAWMLKEANGGTIVSHDLYYESSESAGQAGSSGELTVAQQRDARQNNLSRLAKAQLLALKKLVEST